MVLTDITTRARGTKNKYNQLVTSRFTVLHPVLTITQVSDPFAKKNILLALKLSKLELFEIDENL